MVCKQTEYLYTANKACASMKMAAVTLLPRPNNWLVIINVSLYLYHRYMKHAKSTIIMS